MPSKTPKQAKLMRAIAHGWTPSRMKSPPSQAVAQEFVEADKKYSGGFAENRYWTGGLAAMGEVNSGIDETLNWLKGGHVNYYEEGGEVRPGHAEGKNPHNKLKTPGMYAVWERKHHVAPPATPPPAEPEEPNWWERLTSYSRGLEATEEALKKLEAEGQAYGGRVGYQTGGLAMAAPVGGVPPWIEPVAPGPEYMEEPQGYQFGGAASRYRGVPPQRDMIQRGAPRGGGFNPRQGGALAQLMQRRQAQGGTRPGGMGRIMDRFSQARRGPGPDPHQGRVGPGGVGLSPYEEMENMRRGPRGPLAPGGGRSPLQLPIMDRPNPNIGRPGYDPIGDMGPIYNRPGPIPTRMGGAGKPRPGPGMMPPGEEGEGIPGGPRVPPNMHGYLQKMRMKNRPPSGGVGGGGGNRVGMQDQQGALSRALQRGTGRPPMSRRMAFGRGAQQ